MIPILFEKTATTFTTNGIGRLTDCIRCIVTEERNGMYECEFDYPITGQHYSDITEGRIIAVTHDDNGDIQPFDIYHRTAPLNGVVTFYARHISYRLNGIVVSAFTASGVANAIAGLKTNSIGTNPFTFSTDKTTSGTYTVAVPSTLRAVLGGEENSLLDVFGTGEYEFDKFNVKLWAHRGSDTDVQIRYGKNLSDIEHDVDYSNSYNGVVPYWYSTDPTSEAEDPPIILVTASPVYASGTTYDGRNTVCPLDLTQDFTDAVPTSAELTTLATAKLNASDTLLPNENITVSFVQLWQTEEYANIAPLLKVKLCDTVTVIYPELGISGIRSKVIRVVYNTLLDRYDEIELGDALTSYAALITSDTRSALADLEDGLVMVRGAAQQAIADADAAHTAANTAQGAADDAMAAAGAAQTAAETAEGHAQTALTNAGLAQSAASAAQNSANSANNSANAALTQLGIVEDVVDVLNWISEHGTYKASTDTAVVQGKYYFTRSGTSPNYTYTVVASPTGNPSTQGYYELDSVDEAVSNYISSHLALTNQGLWVVNDNNSYKILLASDGMYVYNPSGTVVGRYGSTAQIGANGSTRFVIDAGKLQAYDSSGNKYFEVSASGLTFGSYTGATTSDIPTNVSQLNNDSNFATTTQAQGYASTAESNAKTYADTGIISNTTLYYASNSTTAPSKPSAHITTNSASTYGAWNIALPTYSSSYPYLYVCTETKTKGGSYAWTSVEQTTYASAISAIKTTADNASSGLTNKADKSSAVASTVSVYYRSTTQSAPSISTSTSIGTSTTTDNAWEYTMPAPKRGCYFYTCEKYTMVDGSVSFSTVRELSSETYASKWVSSADSTYIDGGSIYANSVTANQMAANSITIGNMDSSTRSQVENSNIEIGGRNLVLASNKEVTKDLSTNTISALTRVGYLSDYGKTELGTIGTKVTISFEAKASTAGLLVGGRYIRTADGQTIVCDVTDKNHSITLTTSWVRYEGTCSITATGAGALWIYTGGNTATSGTVYVRNAKVEIGNKATDWTPAPEDTVNENLLIDTQKMSAWSLSSAASRATTDEFGVVTLTGTTSNWNAAVSTVPTLRTSILDGTLLWLSFEYKANVSTAVDIRLSGTAEADGSPALGTRTKYSGNNGSTLATATSWTRVYFAMKTTISELSNGSGNVNSIFVQIYNRTNSSTLQIRKVKLEHGLSATDWTPSPEDQKAYITRIDDTGIRIHPSNTTNNSVLINANGMEVFKGGNSVAMYGDTARVGKETSGHVVTRSNGILLYDNNGCSPFNVNIVGSSQTNTLHRAITVSNGASATLYLPSNAEQISAITVDAWDSPVYRSKSLTIPSTIGGSTTTTDSNVNSTYVLTYTAKGFYTLVITNNGSYERDYFVEYSNTSYPAEMLVNDAYLTTQSFQVMTSDGAGDVEFCIVTIWGKFVSVEMRFYASGSVASGGNIIDSYLEKTWFCPPYHDDGSVAIATLLGAYGNHTLTGVIDSSGHIIVRNTSSSAVNTSPGTVQGTWIMA